MKILLLLLLSFGGFAGEHAHFVKEVFVVPFGYDTNDNVEVTFVAELPNSCYIPSNFNVEETADKYYTLNFNLKRKNISSCDDIGKDELLSPIYYSNTISIGELKEGNYELMYTSKNGTSVEKFNIKQAQTRTMDDMIYAPVTNAFIPDLIYPTSNVNVVLTGIIRSSCLSVSTDDIVIKKIGNLFIVIPEAKMRSNSQCRSIEKPLQKVISLGAIEEKGTYLIHIRSQSGLSVNKIFHVREKSFDPTVIR